MEEKIVVSAYGIISAIGLGATQQTDALLNSDSGLAFPRILKTIHTDFLTGEVKYTNDELAAIMGIDGGDNGYTRTTLLALCAINDLTKTSGADILHQEGLALINANTVGGTCMYEEKFAEMTGPDETGPFVKYIKTIDCADSTQQIVDFYGIKPFTATISTACSSSANALIFGARLIKQGIVKRAVCGGCDALSRFTLNGFLSLKNVSKQACRPFDQERTGLNLGEGAAYMLLETEKAAKERGATILGYLSGYNNSNDAYHATAPSPEGDGAYITMNKALNMAGIGVRDVSYINTHGTATLNNDLAEGRAIERLFQNDTPYFSSTKPFTGHTLAAAGIIEAVFSLIAIREQVVLPNLNFNNKMEELSITPVTSLIKNKRIEHVLSNSFGFGGNNVSLVFSKYA